MLFSSNFSNLFTRTKQSDIEESHVEQDINKTTGATCKTGSVFSSGAPEITYGFWRGSFCLVFSFLYCVVQPVVQPVVRYFFVFFLFFPGIIGSFATYEFKYPFGICRLFWKKNRLFRNILMSCRFELKNKIKHQIHPIFYCKNKKIIPMAIDVNMYPCISP